MMDHPPDEAQTLFRLPPASFIAARNELADAIRDGGDVDGARAIKTLRKPSVPAWAMNQLAERDPEGVASLLEAGAELRAAQHATLSSPQHAGRMREASERRREAVTRLARVAADVLSASGRASNTQLDEITAGLEAASIDPEAGERLTDGTFERPPSPPVGLGDVGGLTSVATGDDVPDAHAAPERGRSSRARPRPDEPVGDRDAILRAEVARLRRDRDAALRRLRKERGPAELLARERTEMGSRLEKLNAKLAEATAKVRSAETEARAAERALKRAEDRLAPT